MKYLPLVWAALWRRKPRTILTMLSVVVAFLLYGLLTAVNAAFNTGVELSGADRLVTTGKYSITQVLPYGYWQQVKNMDGVEQVTFASWFGGYYQEEFNFFPQFPVDPQSYFDVYSELTIDEDQLRAFVTTRTGAVVSKTLADRYGWSLGDRIPITAGIWPLADGSNSWEFDLVGIFDTRDPAARSQHEYMLMQHEYFDEARQFGQGTVGWFISQIRDPEQAGQIAQAIDAQFANSPNETRSDTEKAFNQSFLKQMGDIGLIIQSILGAVFFTLLFLTGNTMMQSVRERIGELAVLKTIGFSGGSLLMIVLAEALLLTLMAALIGLGLAAFLLPGLAENMPGFSGLALDLEAWITALLLALLLALVVGLPPALRAQRLSIVDALSEHA